MSEITMIVIATILLRDATVTIVETSTTITQIEAEIDTDQIETIITMRKTTIAVTEKGMTILTLQGTDRNAMSMLTDETMKITSSVEIIIQNRETTIETTKKGILSVKDEMNQSVNKRRTRKNAILMLNSLKIIITHHQTKRRSDMSTKDIEMVTLWSSSVDPDDPLSPLLNELTRLN